MDVTPAPLPRATRFQPANTLNLQTKLLNVENALQLFAHSARVDSDAGHAHASATTRDHLRQLHDTVGPLPRSLDATNRIVDGVREVQSQVASGDLPSAIASALRVL